MSGHRLVALIEIISPANKDRGPHVDELVDKAVSALERGIHVLLIDLFPPGPHDLSGIHGCVLRSLDQYGEPYDLPTNAPLTLASYVAGPEVDVYLEHLAVGGAPGGYAAIPAARPACQRSARDHIHGHVPRRSRILAQIIEGRPPDAC